MALFFTGIILGILPASAETTLVLPFSNLSKSGNLDWVGESIAETVRDSLVGGGVLVLDRESRAEAYRRLSIRPYSAITRASAVKLADAVDADVVIYGKFEVADVSNPADKASLRINASVIDPEHLRLSQEFSETGALNDLAELQNRVAWRVLQYLRPETALSEEAFRKKHRAMRLDALEYYIRGLLSPTGEQKHRFLTQAARLDPEFSKPCFELGKLQWEQENYRVAAGWFERVDADNPHFYESKFLLGLSRFHMGDYAAAQKEFQLVLAVMPLNEVLNNVGAAQSRQEQAEALENFRKASEGDPADPDYHFNIGYALWKQGKFVEAAPSFRAVLERDPEDEQASELLERCQKESGPRPGELNSEPLERVKYEYPEAAYRQLKELLKGSD